MKEAVTILIVDKNKKVYNKLKKILNKDYLIINAKSGLEAISLADKINPDLILVNLNFSDLDGNKLCEKLKQGIGLDDIPLIFIVNHENQDIGLDCLNLPLFDVISRSFSGEFIAKRINNYISLCNYKDSAKNSNQIIEQSPETILITNTSGEIEYVNPRFINLTGYNPDEVIGKNPRFLKSGFHSEKFYNELWETISSGGKWHGEIYNRKKNGEFFWEETSISSIKNPRGEISKYIAIKYDITGRKKDEKKLKEYSEKIEFLYERLNNEFKKGIRLHKQFLPEKLPKIDGFSYEVYFQPAERLGGDFYNAIKIDKYLLIYLADVSGHGLDGSMLNIFIRETINSYISNEVNGKLNQSVDSLLKYIIERYHQEEFSKDYMVCLLIGLLDIDERKFSFINAGIQVPPIIVRENGSLKTLENSGAPISTAIDIEFYNKTLKHEIENFKIFPGDKLMLTTDGLVEGISYDSENNFSEMYGEERLHNLLLKFHDHNPEEIIEKIKTDFKNYTGNEIGNDDITYLVMSGEENNKFIGVK